MFPIKPISQSLFTLFFLIAFLIPQSAFPLTENKTEGRSDITVVNAMADELKRSQTELKLEGYEPPYFISYQIKDNAYTSIQGKYGAIVDSDMSRIRRLFVDVPSSPSATVFRPIR